MALLNRTLYKKIEDKLHSRAKLRALVDDHMAVRPPFADPSRPCSAASSPSDPTAAAAIRRASPPPAVLSAIKWLEVARLTEQKYAGTTRGLFLNAYYDGRPTKGKLLRVCRDLAIEQATAYDYREAIVNYTALLAAAAGLVASDDVV